jgi:GNAT superfamily N-acetyltransferase
VLCFQPPLTCAAMAATVRRIRAEDWSLLRDLRLQSLKDAPQAFGQTYENAAAISDDEWKSNAKAAAHGDSRTWLIGDIDGAGVGLVQGRRRPADDCLVFSMWVAPGARRSGLGRMLIDGVATWAAEWGARRIVLWVLGTNEDAHRFYERIGFAVVQSGADAESGRSFGAFAMERPIA